MWAEEKIKFPNLMQKHIVCLLKPLAHLVSVFHNTVSNFSCLKSSNQVWYRCVLHMTFTEYNMTFKAQNEPYIQGKTFGRNMS